MGSRGKPKDGFEPTAVESSSVESIWLDKMEPWLHFTKAVFVPP